MTFGIGCTIKDGLKFGSCSYNDLCKDVFQDIANFTSPNCPPEFVELGIDCNCPFNIPIKSFDSEFDIEDLMILGLYLSPFGIQGVGGDYDVTITINNSANQHVACLRFKFTVYRG